MIEEAAAVVTDKSAIITFAVPVFFLMIRRPPRSTLDRSSAASDVYKRQTQKHCQAMTLVSVVEG